MITHIDTQLKTVFDGYNDEAKAKGITTESWSIKKKGWNLLIEMDVSVVVWGLLGCDLGKLSKSPGGRGLGIQSKEEFLWAKAPSIFASKTKPPTWVF